VIAGIFHVRLTSTGRVLVSWLLRHPFLCADSGRNHADPGDPRKFRSANPPIIQIPNSKQTQIKWKGVSRLPFVCNLEAWILNFGAFSMPSPRSPITCPFIEAPRPNAPISLVPQTAEACVNFCVPWQVEFLTLPEEVEVARRFRCGLKP